MAYTPHSVASSSGDPISAADWNTYVTNNFEAGIPATFAAIGDLFFATAADAGAKTTVGANYTFLGVDAAQTNNVAWFPFGSMVARYTRSTSAQTFTSAVEAVVNFDVKTYDTDTAVTTGAGWVYTVPAGKGGYFIVISAMALVFASTSWIENEIAQLNAYVDSSFSGRLDTFVCEAASASIGTIGLSGMTIVAAEAAQTIDIRVLQTSGEDATTVTTDTDKYCYVAIARIGSTST